MVAERVLLVVRRVAILVELQRKRNSCQGKKGSCSRRLIKAGVLGRALLAGSAFCGTRGNRP